MKIRQAKKIVEVAAKRHTGRTGSIMKALNVIWHQSRYPEGPRKGERMGSSVKPATLTRVARILKEGTS